MTKQNSRKRKNYTYICNKSLVGSAHELENWCDKVCDETTNFHHFYEIFVTQFPKFQKSFTKICQNVNLLNTDTEQILVNSVLHLTSENKIQCWSNFEAPT